MKWLFLLFGSLAVATLLILVLQTATPRPKKPKPQASATVNPAEGVSKEIEYAKSLAKSGELVEAIRILKKLRDSDPRLVESYLEAGNIYLAAGQFQGALDEWKQGLEKVGDHPQLLIALGKLYLQVNKDPLTAMSLLKKAENIDPKAAGLSSAMGEVVGAAAEALLAKGENDAAREAAKRAIELQGDSLAGNRVMGKLAEGEGRWEEAAGHWEKVFSAAATGEHRRFLAEAHKRAGYILLAKKNRDGAILHFKRSVELAAEGVDLTAVFDFLRQESKTAMEEGAKAFEAKDYAKAKELFSYCASLLPDNPLAQNHLGLALLKLGEKPAAIQAWEQAISQAERTGVDLSLTPTHKNLILLYKELGKPEEAERVAKDYIKKYPKGLQLEEIRKLSSK